MVGLYNRSTQGVILSNDNSACLRFLIISLSPYFYFVFGLYFSNHLEYFDVTLQHYTTDQHRQSHARMITLIVFIFLLSPLVHIVTSFLACISAPIWNILMMLCRIIQQVSADSHMHE